uniref:Uracil-DNA glycosylase n=1 Tax=Ciona savignyi TaxID=51511 RepID=H2Y540_CIOSA
MYRSAMSYQTKITTLFSPKLSGKRTSTDPTAAHFQTKRSKCDKENKSFIQSTQVSQTPKLETRKDVIDTAICHSMGKTWRDALKSELNKPYFTKLIKYVENERTHHTIYPPPEQVFSWTHHCNIRDTKVVILGQDPYHGPHQAHGLCFSVQKGVDQPPSLKNIFKELASDEKVDGGFEIPEHGNLTKWAKQGVLLLNAVLTVRKSEPNSHKDKGWEKLTDAVISWISSNLENVVFMLWGSYAQKKGSRIDKSRHLILKSVHPSPLSAYRGFLGCHHFSKANQHLESHGKPEIDWNL